MKVNVFLVTLILGLFTIQTNSQEKNNGQEIDSISSNSINYRFSINNLDINDEFQNFGTTFYEENKVVYSSENEETGILDLFVGTIDEDGAFVNPKKIESLSTKSFESNVTFTKDSKTVYFTRSMYGKINTTASSRDIKSTIAVFKADVSEGGVWSNVLALPFNSKGHDVGHPTLSADDSKLYFTSNMPGGYGNADIYYVDILSDGSFSKPENMGKEVNSKYKEVFPHIKGDALYFSSNREDEGLGGLDVYAVKIYESGKVSRRVHLDPPVNSTADDFSYIYNDQINRGYFSSNRRGGKGSDDIYSYTETRPLSFDCYQTISGVIISDGSKKDPLPFTEVVLFDVFGKEVNRMTTDKDGVFKFEQAKCNDNYKIKASKRRLGSKEVNFVTKKLHNSDNYFVIKISDNFIVTKRGKQMLDIFNIYFESDSSKITKRAAGQLNMVVAIMGRYPSMVIELGSHTDSRGPDKYNLTLSDARAQATVEYIINKGEIPKERISGKGYGETRPLNHCSNGVKCKKKEHSVNRRSEFVITSL